MRMYVLCAPKKFKDRWSFNYVQKKLKKVSKDIYNCAKKVKVLYIISTYIFAKIERYSRKFSDVKKPIN